MPAFATTGASTRADSTGWMMRCIPTHATGVECREEEREILDRSAIPYYEIWECEGEALEIEGREYRRH